MSNCSMRASWSTGPSRRHPILTAYFVFRRQRPPASVAKRNYLVEGLSGAGKSSVYEELIRRGYKAISTDLWVPETRCGGSADELDGDSEVEVGPVAVGGDDGDVESFGEG